MAKKPFWVTFKSKPPVCVESSSESEAGGVAARLTGAEVLSVASLPYPADPRIGEKSDCPSLCYEPRKCAGRTCCPQRYACSE